MKLRGDLTVPCGFVVVALLALSAPTAADTFIKQSAHTDAFAVMGQEQPAKDDTTITWLAEDKAYMLSGDNKAFILRADKGIMYFIDHAAQTYSEMPLEALGDVKKMAGIEDDEEAAQAAEMMQGLASGMMASMKVTVTPTDEEKKVGDWNTKKYVVEMKMPMGSLTSEIWASKDIKLDYDLFRTISNSFMAMMPGFQNTLKEMEKIEGVSVLSVTETNMMGARVKSTTELLECSEKEAPDGTFDLPEGYKKVDMHKMGQPH